MILIKSRYKLETPIDGENATRILKLIESAARTCYKSECKITEDSYKSFVRKIVQVNKHESVIEHSSFSVRFIVDRGISHELVRHRLASFSQESTRYVDYSDDKKTEGHCQFIIPSWCPEIVEGEYEQLHCDRLITTTGEIIPMLNATTCIWLDAMQMAEENYKRLRELGWRPEQARSVLPNSIKTEIVVTANAREWRHILKMRTSPQAHPQLKEVMVPLLSEFKLHLPELFEDI